MRELVLSNEGVTLADVYQSSGEVLMGTLRWENEERERLEQRRARNVRESKRRELELALKEAQNRLSLLQHELDLRISDLAVFETESDESSKRQYDNDATRSRLRGAD